MTLSHGKLIGFYGILEAQFFREYIFLLLPRALLGSVCSAFRLSRRQIKQMTAKLNDLKLTKQRLLTREMDLRGQDIDQDGSKAKIGRTLKNLKCAPNEKQRPVFTNLVKFIEIHPMKIKN